MIAANFPLGSNFGWGVCGSNLKREFAKTDKVCWFERRSDESGVDMTSTMPLLQAISGPQFSPADTHLWSSKRNVGYAFLEDFETAAKCKGNTVQWDKIAVGSTWCAEMMKERLGIDAAVVIQGVDTERFKPQVQGEITPLPEFFTIFSGGKFEYRKGQDLVIAAFKVLAERYKDVCLIGSWVNFWPGTMESMTQSKHIEYRSGWTATETMQRNGIPADRYSLPAAVPNEMMNWAYHQADVAVFPNRCEAGTNLPLMECMACGVPVIATYATGHKDVLPRSIVSLEDNKVLDNGWVEPSLDELISCLEMSYESRGRLQPAGDIWRQNIQQFTWEKTAAELIAIAEG